MVFSATGNRKVGAWYGGMSEVMIASHYQRVYRMACIATRDSELSKDVTQEAFLTAFIKIDTLKDKDKFGNWVCAIAVNLSKDMLRKRNREKRMNDPLFDEHGNLHSGVTAASTLVPEEWCESREDLRAILKCLGELDIEERQVIILKFFQGMSYVEISHALKIKESTLRMRALRAKEKISNKVKYHFGKEDD